MSTIKVIFAIGPNGEFGKGHNLPWYAPEDLEHFKEYTGSTTLVMSPACFRSLPGKLKGRKHVIVGDHTALAKNGSEPDLVISSTDHIPVDEEICVIGGRSMIKEFVEIADEVCITHIDSELVGEADIHIRMDEINEILLGRSMSVESKSTSFGRIDLWKL